MRLRIILRSSDVGQDAERFEVLLHFSRRCNNVSNRPRPQGVIAASSEDNGTAPSPPHGAAETPLSLAQREWRVSRSVELRAARSCSRSYNRAQCSGKRVELTCFTNFFLYEPSAVRTTWTEMHPIGIDLRDAHRKSTSRFQPFRVLYRSQRSLPYSAMAAQDVLQPCCLTTELYCHHITCDGSSLTTLRSSMILARFLVPGRDLALPCTQTMDFHKHHQQPAGA